MFLTNEVAEVEVHDQWALSLDGSAVIIRRYRFINDSAKSVVISWEGSDELPNDRCEVRVMDGAGRFLGLAPGPAPRALWELKGVSLEEGSHVDVFLEIAAPDVFLSDPLALKLYYSSKTRVRYSFSIEPPVASLLTEDRRQVRMSGPFAAEGVLTTSTGVLTSAKSFLVSANRSGRLEMEVKKEAPTIESTRVMAYYQNLATGSPRCFEGKVAVVIPHLLQDSLSYFRALREAGLEPDKTFIVGIPYSWKAEVVGLLWEQGYSHIDFPETYPFDDAVDSQMRAALQRCDEGGDQLIILEDGGYAGPLLHEKYPEYVAKCDGVVEQTRNGIWQYKDRAIELQVPVVNVAECSLKLQGESPLIGEAVVFNIRRLLGKAGWSLNGQPTLVVGFGSTGSRIAESLASQNVDVAVYDEDPERRNQAAEGGFTTDDSLLKLLENRTLIIGATGREPFQFPQLVNVEHNAILVNASSKRREFSHKELGNLRKIGTESEVVRSTLTRITLINDRHLNLLADGYPVNFVGESVPDEDISFIMALLYRAARYLVEENSQLSPGFSEIPSELMEEVEGVYSHLVRPMGEDRHVL